MKIIWIIKVAVLTSSLLAGGCVTCWPKDKLRFEVLDAQTRKPLEGVVVERSSRNRMLMTMRVFGGKDGTFAVGTTGADGMVRAEGLCSDLSHGFYFRKEGYREGVAFWYHGAKSVGGSLAPNDPARLRRGREIYADARGVYTVLMYLEKTPVVTRLEWKRVDDPPKFVVEAADRLARPEGPPGLENFRMETPREFYTDGVGDWRIVWIGKEQTARGFRWEWNEIGPDGGRVIQQAGFSATSPRAEMLRGWEH